MKAKNGHQAAQTDAEEASADNWFADENYDGQLAVDVYETPKDIVIRSAIAGVLAEDLEISINRDVVTIRGKRRKDESFSQHQYLFQECYWGGFSRTIILPMEVDSEHVDASLKNGILTVALPKLRATGARVVAVRGEE